MLLHSAHDLFTCASQLREQRQWSFQLRSLSPPLLLVHNLSFSHSCGGMPLSAQSICTDVRKYVSWWVAFTQSQTMNCYRNSSTLQCVSTTQFKHVMVTAEVEEPLHQLSGKHTIQQSRLSNFEFAFPWNSQPTDVTAWKHEVWLKALFRTLPTPPPLPHSDTLQGSMLHFCLSSSQARCGGNQTIMYFN